VNLDFLDGQCRRCDQPLAPVVSALRVTPAPCSCVEGGIPEIVDGQCAGAIGVSGVFTSTPAIADAGLKALDGSGLVTAPTGGPGINAG
jgi:uncharacterized protein GlcG (DUF336 family)